MGALAEAVKAGFQDGARLFGDSDLHIIRQEPGYRDLVLRFQNRPNASGPK
jgi:hypothetical protein